MQIILATNRIVNSIRDAGTTSNKSVDAARLPKILELVLTVDKNHSLFILILRGSIAQR